MKLTAGLRLWILIGLTLIALAGTSCAGSRSFVYFPGGSLPEPAAAGLPEAEGVTVATSDGLALTAWLVPATADQPVVLFFHGNAGTIAGRAGKARLLRDAGYGILLAEYRGYGGNPGRPSERGLALDARAAIDTLSARGVPPGTVVLYGESLGTGVAVRLATERPVRAIILEAPFTSLIEVGKHLYPFLPVEQLAWDRFDSLSRIGEVRAPLLIIHGERDQLVPSRMGRTLLAAAREPKSIVFLPVAGHNDVYRYGAGQAVLEFLDGLDR
jgi:fermentation-respiration switch protein FrsA (DUF1100 family)